MADDNNEMNPDVSPSVLAAHSAAPIFMLVGPPAVGKSTTSRALAAHFPKGVHIPVDDLREMVVSGKLLPGAEWSSELAQQISLARASAAHMALRYHAAGFAVVIDDFWDANHAADYSALLAHPRAHKIILYPEQSEAHLRNLQRAGESAGRAYIDEGIRIVYRQLAAELPTLAQSGWLVVDSTALDIAGVVSAVLQQTGVSKNS